jgi:hypothetical protein
MRDTQKKIDRPLLGNFYYQPMGAREETIRLNRSNTPTPWPGYAAASVAGLAACPGSRLALPQVLAPQPMGRWHWLELRVTPARTTAYLDGLPLTSWDRAAPGADLNRWWRANLLFIPNLPPAPPAFPVSGGLGLLADRATVIVRNVSVSP